MQQKLTNDLFGAIFKKTSPKQVKPPVSVHNGSRKRAGLSPALFLEIYSVLLNAQSRSMPYGRPGKLLQSEARRRGHLSRLCLHLAVCW